MLEALNNIPSNILVMGNLDPVGLFKQANAEQVFTATQELLERTRKYPNFILSTGCDIPPHIPHRNIEAFYQAASLYQ